MNVVTRAIVNGKDRMEVKGKHTWAEFGRTQRGKKLYLFGANAAGEYFIRKYGKRYPVCAVVDNDTSKWGSRTGLGMEVHSPEILREADDEHTVIIISSTNYYTEISGQLEQAGFHSYFVLCKMEARKVHNVMLRICYQTEKRIWEAISRKYGWNKGILQKRLLFYKNRVHPIQRHKLLFISGGKYKEHEKYISEALYRKERGLDLVWLLDREEQCPAYARRVEMENTEEVIYEMATAKIWFNSDNFPLYVSKRRGQYYIQTKHWASVALKKFYFDTPLHFKTRPWLKYVWKHDVGMYDYIITGGQFDEMTCRSGFRYHGKFMNAGSPRTDILFAPEAAEREVKKAFGISPGGKILLYAPTFRISGNQQEYESEINEDFPDFKLLLDAVAGRFGGDWYVLLRLHPFVAHKRGCLDYSARVLDASGFPDIQQLLAASEIIITDYSSLMFEPALVQKKVFLYITDIERYTSEERELWFKLQELPFPLAENDKQLKRVIDTFSENEYLRRVQDFLELLQVREDGHACDRVAERILQLLKS